MTTVKNRKNTIIAAGLVLFGLLTIIGGGKALFTEVGLQTRGNIVPLVLWFNFIAGFFYVIGGISAYRLKSCVKRLSVLLAATNIGVYIYLLSHVSQGGVYETKTMIAMSIRTLVWISVSIYFSKSELFKQKTCGSC